MTEVGRRHVPTVLDMREWFGFDPFAIVDWRPKMDFHPIRIEDRFEEDAYVLSAEIPGIDPEHDVELVVSEGTLTILAERSSAEHDKRHTEFRYGAFSRAVRLPAGAKEEEITAAYSGGILTVRVPLAPPAKAATRKIAVNGTEAKAQKN
ncbi:MAG: Hsp20/alpha crystallin family protein [Catenulispora sp.]|nr:Hsp20/alpha crystallin family protein [Catenulispora sp.]